MTTPTDHSNYLLTRICHELEHLPLTGEQKAKVTSKLVKHACFMDTDGGRKKGGNFRADSGLFDFQRKLDTLTETFADQGLTGAGYLGAALKQPSLFMQSPTTIAANITGLVAHFADEGLTTRDYLRAALRTRRYFVSLLPRSEPISEA